MSNQKLLEEVVKLIFADFRKDKDTTRALRRIHMAQINLARRMLPEEAKLIGNLKPFFKKKGGVNQNG